MSGKAWFGIIKLAFENSRKTSTIPFSLFGAFYLRDAFTSIALSKDSFITQDRNEPIKGVKVEATFSRGHISLI